MTQFIKIKKNEEIIEVHPDALEDHVKNLGWHVVEEIQSKSEEPEPVAVDPIAQEMPEDAAPIAVETPKAKKK
jgi:hypothetical protein